MKKTLISAVLLTSMLTGCNAGNVNQPQGLTSQSINAQSAKAPAKNGLFGFTISQGQMYFFDQTPGKTGIYASPQVFAKKLITNNKFNKATLTMPGSEVSGYFKAANDGGLYLEDYTSKNNYRVGSWTKKGGFTKKEAFEKFDIKLENIKDVKAELHLNPMSHEYLFLISSTDIKPVQKKDTDFELSKFMAKK